MNNHPTLGVRKDYNYAVRLQHLSDIPLTLAHDNLKRQRFIGPGELKSKVQTVNYVELALGKSFTPHTHPDCEECFFVIEGKAEATVEGETFDLNKGDFLVV